MRGVLVTERHGMVLAQPDLHGMVLAQFHIFFLVKTPFATHCLSAAAHVVLSILFLLTENQCTKLFLRLDGT